MATFVENNSSGIPIRIHPRKGESIQGMMHYGCEGPRVVFHSREIPDHLDGAAFSIIEGSELAKMANLGQDDRILVDPELVVEMNYSLKRESGFEMYPPSTGGWLSHVVDSGTKSVFTIQRVLGTSKRFLTIFGKASKELVYAGFIQPYESSILTMSRDWNILNAIYDAGDSESDVSLILKEKSFSWSTLAKLVEGVTIPNLTIGNTIEETLTQIVPESFSRDVRVQIMAFLAWLDKAEIPKEDPIDFIIKHRSASVYDLLVRKHLQCMLDNVEPPQYIRILHMADKGQIELAMRPQSEAFEQDPWTLVVLKLHELFPDWTGRVIEYIVSLQNQNRLVTKLPVSRAEARTSRKAWSNRFAMVNRGLTMRGFVYKESIGLVPAIYIGGAHRWPHKHLEWSARLGYGTEKPQYIQIMAMPKSALERISRVIPAVRLVNWDLSCVNATLYSDRTRKWNLKTGPIIKSLERKRSLKQLSNEFDRWTGKNTFPLSQKQVRILDLISWGMTLGDIETERYAKYYGITNLEIKKELNDMHKHGVFALQYFLIPEKIRSLCIIANGRPEKICSMSRAFLKHTPSTQVRITEGGSSCVIVSRVPEDEYFKLITNLNEAVKESEIALRALPISAYVGYRNNLYSRLIKDDGSWDDDVSGLLSQVRLPTKNNEV
jgi:hypothetical protein